MNKVLVNMGDFSKAPFGRTSEDGTYNGERFRKEVIIAKLNELKKGELLVINMDEGIVDGYEYGSSFLHEAFGGLVLHEGLTEIYLSSVLKIETEFEDVRLEAWEYIHAPEKYI